LRGRSSKFEIRCCGSRTAWIRGSQKAKAELDALPDPERDDGNGGLEAVNPPPELLDREQMEAQTAEDVITKKRGDAGEAQPVMHLDVPGNLGVTLAPPDKRADGFICGRDRKAARGAWLREQRKRRK
jgi:hypothetical protein